MDIREFVKASLVQIIEGVADAIQEKGGHAGSTINPEKGSSLGIPMAEIQNVNFDIAVTVQEDTAVRGSGGMTVAIFKANGNAEISSGNTAVSRLSFSVPVRLPVATKK